ncbi:MAG: metal-dependent transcriptional regulator [Chloroflexi bacterium]|nr:metal-dependent transcriptional regulator [Chloroflexota bacterium]
MSPDSAAEQDYLKQIYLLQEDTGRATTQALAERLGVKPPSVTAMIKKLAEDEGGPLVRHTPYHGVQLTERGVAVALEMLRHHRLIETFLSELLGVPWHQVHEEAERLEHVLSEDLEERIAAKLGNPSFDPHGDPIPSREGVIPRRELSRLTELAPGASGTVARLEQQERPVLEYLASLGLVLNACVTLESIAPFGGVVTVRVGPPGAEVSRAIGQELAEHIHLAAAKTGTERAAR